MKEIKNILITTLGRTTDMVNVSYYHFKNELDEVSFCTGISNAEAGTKYMLSHHKIDQIYVLIPDGGEGVEEESIEIRSTAIPTVITPDSVSELEFYCYRIAQFLSNIDIEANDVLFDCDQEKRRELRDKINHIIPEAKSDLFYSLATDDVLYETYKSFMEEHASKKEADIQAFALYSEMDSFFKMRSLKSNDRITVKCLRVEKLPNGDLCAESLFNTVEGIFSEKNVKYNLYMDLQGIDRGNSASIWNILTIHQNIGDSLSIQSMICTQKNDDLFTNAIYDENERYNIEQLLSAIRAFLLYGKTEQFEDYFIRRDIKHSMLKNILNAMKYVDTGVSLNNISDLTNGIQMLRILTSMPAAEDMSPGEMFVYGLIRSLLHKDYGRMLIAEKLELTDMISWAVRKHFYQQALTMVEALVPEDMVRKGIYYYARNQNDIEKMNATINVAYWCDEPRNRFAYNDINHYFVKNYGRQAMGFVPKDKRPAEFAKLKVKLLHEKVEGVECAYSNINNDDMLYELLLNYYSLGDLRNNVSHAVCKVQNLTALEEVEENKSAEMITRALKTFLGIYRSACKRASKDASAPEPVILTPEAFRSYRTRHRIFDLPVDDFRNIREQHVECIFNGNVANIRIQLHKVREDEE